MIGPVTILGDDLVVTPFVKLHTHADTAYALSSVDLVDLNGDPFNANYIEVIGLDLGNGTSNGFVVEFNSYGTSGGNTHLNTNSAISGIYSSAKAAAITSTASVLLPDGQTVSSINILSKCGTPAIFAIHYGYALPYNPLRSTIR
jgi:hypothetical protein